MKYYEKNSLNSYDAVGEYTEAQWFNFDEYDNQPAVPGSWSNTRISKKCKSLNTKENHAIYSGDYFTSSYSKYIHLFAKVGDSYYCISDKINLN